ncbi:hypothetical protein [Rhodoblastus sp.]|uniref:hypothetical protein n=1 Tax=Rhodoblastus sp. TaxID=1962975 RepID=UPI003F96FAC3
MTNIRGYYEGGALFDGNPKELKSGMVLKGRRRNIQEFIWSHFPQRLAVAECLGVDIDIKRRFVCAVINSLAALEEALDEPCSTPIEHSHGCSQAEVVNVGGRWRWDVIQWTHDGRRRNCMVASFRKEADLVLATVKLRGQGDLSEVPPRALLDHHGGDFDNTFDNRYKWKEKEKPVPDAAPFFSCNYWSL